MTGDRRVRVQRRASSSSSTRISEGEFSEFYKDGLQAAVDLASRRKKALDIFEEGVQAAMDSRLTSITGVRHVGGKPVKDVMDPVNGACVCPVCRLERRRRGRSRSRSRSREEALLSCSAVTAEPTTTVQETCVSHAPTIENMFACAVGTFFASEAQHTLIVTHCVNDRKHVRMCSWHFLRI
jgi:hypothetical protein